MDRAELEALLAPHAPISEEEKELREWLKLNKETLADRDPCEVVELAFMNQFPAPLVYSVIVDFHGAISGNMLEKRAALHYFSFSVAMEDRSRLQAKLDYVKELDLKPLWKELYDNQISGEQRAA